MLVLGVNENHLATACLIDRGRIVACASEERFTGIKNQAGFPHNAIEYVMRAAGGKPLDLVVLSWRSPFPLFAAEMRGSSRPEIIRKLSRMHGYLRYRLSPVEPLFAAASCLYRQWLNGPFQIWQNPRRKSRYAALLGVRLKDIITADHHTCHAYSLFISPDAYNAPLLVLTLDAGGDGLCATVNTIADGELQRLAATPDQSSPGWLYAETTRYLGLKPLEDEHKVMGLAPYAHPGKLRQTYSVMRELIGLHPRNPLVFAAKRDTRLTYQFLRHRLEGHRFDQIAAAVQRLTENLVCKWVEHAIVATRLPRLGLAGGVFMNVKLNLAISELPCVDKMFVFPSGGDESTAIGAALYGYKLLCDLHGDKFRPTPMRELYWGPDYSEEDFASTLAGSGIASRFSVERCQDIGRVIAELLGEGEIVARRAGPNEWGARALGNSSILAPPESARIVRLLNEKIKNRDFWMPFAPTILHQRSHDYVINPKDIPSPYMNMAFRSTRRACKELPAAMHPYDFTMRPQILAREWNQAYFDIIQDYEAITGIGGVLNTSFNLHGEPMVCSPAQALSTFARSGLKYLALGDFLIRKN